MSPIKFQNPPPKTTAERLAEVLGAAGLDEMAGKALTGEYGDFTSPHDFPKAMLVQILEGRGLYAIAERVRDGEFDD